MDVLYVEISPLDFYENRGMRSLRILNLERFIKIRFVVIAQKCISIDFREIDFD